MKRILSFMVSIIVTIACLPFAVFAVNAEVKNDIKRYSVLVLDISGTAKFTKGSNLIYTADSAIDYVKKSAKSFLRDLINAKGENYVAIVTYAADSSVVLNFTDDIAEAEKRVDSLTVRQSSRNVNSGLVAANNLLMKEDPSAIKNVILVTPGHTNSGDYLTDGHYNTGTVGSTWYNTTTGIHLYKYANAAYNTAEQLKEIATIYVLGVFQTMEGMPSSGKEVAAFFRLFASDLATSEVTFFDVDDPEKIGFAFGEIANGINLSKGLFRYAGQIGGKEKPKREYEAEYYYSDSYFYDSAIKYNPSLATMSLCLELSTWTSFDNYHDKWYDDDVHEDDEAFWNDKLYNVKALLLGKPDDGVGYEGIGFSNFKANEFWKDAPEKDSIGVCAARKQITDRSGDDYTLIALVVRGGGYGSEWASNFKMGIAVDHKGFATARDDVLEFLNEYVSDLNEGESKNVKLWITGFSRAGATANMVAGALGTLHYLPIDIKTSIDDIYCYTFEAPQGAIKSKVTEEDYRNIHNIRNMNDLVPFVAPSNWDFARYNFENDRQLPSKAATANFNEQLKAMLKQMDELGYPDFEYKISEKISIKDMGILKYSSPLIKMIPDINASYSTYDVLNDGISYVAGGVIPSRADYYMDFEETVGEILGIVTDYYGKINGLGNYADRIGIYDFIEDLSELFKIVNLAYILDPVVPGKAYVIFRKPLEEVENRLSKKISEIFVEYSEIVGFNQSLTFVLLKTFSSLADDLLHARTKRLAQLIRFVDALASSELQAHFPEICLAWCRSFDPNYNDEIINSNSNITRIIHINCPVNVNVYDSNNELVASITDETNDESIDGIISYVSDTGEKVLYLPGDGTYTLNIEAYDDGTVNYSLCEYNYVYSQETRLQNYYDIPVVKGDVIRAVVPAISDDELTDNDVNGSTAEYQLFHNNELLSLDEEFNGEAILEEYYDVTLETEGNGGYVNGAGSFMRGGFADLEAFLFPEAEFLGWYSDDELISTDLEYRFAVKEDMTITAKFSDITYSQIDFEIDGEGTINAFEGSYPANYEIDLEAVPAEGYEFVEWTSSNGGVFEDPKSAETVFVVPDEDTTVTAHFKPVGSEPPTPPVQSDILGDANCDGVVDLSDAVLIMQALNNPNSYGKNGSAENRITDQGWDNGDVNNRGDGLTNSDALSIQKFLLGIISSFPDNT